MPVDVHRSREEKECHQAVAVSLLKAVFTADIVFTKTLPEAETRNKAQLAKVKKWDLLVIWC